MQRRAGIWSTSIRKPQVYRDHTDEEPTCGWAQPFRISKKSLLCEESTPSFRQSSTLLLFENQTSAYYWITSVWKTNRGNKGLSLYRTTSELSVTVMSTTGFNSTEVLLCDNMLCSLITDSRSTDLNIRA